MILKNKLKNPYREKGLEFLYYHHGKLILPKLEKLERKLKQLLLKLMIQKERLKL